MDTVEPLYKGHVGDRPFVPWREVGSEVIMYYHYERRVRLDKIWGVCS